MQPKDEDFKNLEHKVFAIAVGTPTSNGGHSHGYIGIVRDPGQAMGAPRCREP